MASKALPDFVVVRFVFAGMFVVLLGFTGRARNFSFAICARRRWLEGETHVGLERRPVESGANFQPAFLLRMVLVVRSGVAVANFGRRGGDPCDQSFVKSSLGARCGEKRGLLTVVVLSAKIKRADLFRRFSRVLSAKIKRADLFR